MTFDTWQREITGQRIPDYLVDLMRMEESGQLTAAVYDVDVYHADDCPIWRGGVCNCGPDVVVTVAGGGDDPTAGENCVSLKG